MVLSIIVHHFTALGSRGMPPMPPTILMSGQLFLLPAISNHDIFILCLHISLAQLSVQLFKCVPQSLFYNILFDA